ncbi:MAG: hypothetical protein JWN13_393 [Betaproteobacteria bacterium]|nr:hypothetical protein [Betaproteobacteria bacterium]
MRFVLAQRFVLALACAAINGALPMAAMAQQ